MPESQKNIIHIKNMVCPRCVESVQQTLIELSIPFQNVRLGEVSLSGEVNDSLKQQLSKNLKNKGFELIEDYKSRVISQLKSNIILWVNDHQTNRNLSDFLSEELNSDYSSLTKLFSEVEGITLEKYTLKIKVEKIKELIFYDDLTLAEIAEKLNYSSVAYLSSMFKKETGMTPTQFKKLRSPQHKNLSDIK